MAEIKQRNLTAEDLEDLVAFWLCRFYEPSIQGREFWRAIEWKRLPDDKKYWHRLHARELIQEVIKPLLSKS
jgi:hypothetical protein